MKRRLSIIIIVSMLICIFSFSGYSAGSDSDQDNPNKEFSGGKVYTAYNIWYETGKENSLWCINYKTGIIIPAGTEVSDVEVTKSSISFTTVNDQKKYRSKFNDNYHPGKTTEDYGKMMFSEKDFNQLTQGMSQTEIDAIKGGVIKIGMSKQSVIVCYGYPPEHKTPDLNGNVWIYWMNKFVSKAINFDENGKTIKPPEENL
jgi:hypothetical protein